MPTSLRRKLLSSLAAPTGLLLAIAGAVACGTARRAWSAMPTTSTCSTRPPDAANQRARPEPVESRSGAAQRFRHRFAVRDLVRTARRAALRSDGDAMGCRLAGASTPPVGRDPRRPPRRPPRDRCSATSSMRASPSAPCALYRKLPAGGFYVTVAETLVKREAAMDRLFEFSPPAPCSCSPPASPLAWASPAVSPRSSASRSSLRRRSGADLSPIDPRGVPDEVREVVAHSTACSSASATPAPASAEFLQDAATSCAPRSPACRCSSSCSSRARSTRPRVTAFASRWRG